MVTGYSFTKRLIVVPKDPFSKQWSTHILLFSFMHFFQGIIGNLRCRAKRQCELVSRYSLWFIRQLSSFSACKILGTTTANWKLELGHIAPVHSTTCVRYPHRLLPQNTIYLVNKSLLNTKIHLPAWQQLTDCETSVNPDQTFCFWVLLADVMRLLRNGHCACLAGSDMRSS